jgi:uncharacterized protein YbjT (DUF2867 family)
LIVGDDFYCIIGTTINKAGSKKAFRKVDFEYPKLFAKIAAQNKIKQFLIISSLGADLNSSNFYLKTKGEIENLLKASTLKSVTILWPSLLLGNRAEFRLGEKVSAFFLKYFSFLLIRSFEKYKPTESKTVAKTLYVIVKQYWY